VAGRGPAHREAHATPFSFRATDTQFGDLQPMALLTVSTIVPMPQAADQTTVPTDVMPASDREQRLHRATVAMMRCRCLDELFDKIIASILDLTRADTVLILLTHETGEYLTCVAVGGQQSTQLLGAHRQAGEGLVGETWAGGVPVFVDDVTAAGSTHPWSAGTQAYLHPLADGGGVIAAVASGPDGALQGDIDQLARLGELASAAIQNARAAEAVSQALLRTRALGEVSRQLFELDNATDACDAACRMMLSAADISRASSFLVDEHGDLLPHVSWQMSDAGIAPGVPIPTELVRHSIAQRAVDGAATIRVSRTDVHAPSSHALEAALAHQDIGSAMAIPLLKAGTPVGAIVVTRHRSRQDLSDGELDVCHAVINQLCTALERSDLARELAHRAWHDGLTGLPNRSRFEATLNAALSDDAPRSAVMFIDLDGFKRINDTLGHARGDALLQHVARRLRSQIKASDLLARMGGDEFAILLHEGAGAVHVARRVLAALRTPFDLDGERVGIGASIGLCRCPEDGDTIDTLLRHADVAMYDAKHVHGGGLVSFTPELILAAHEREALEADLEVALMERQFELAYQPQVSCHDARVPSMEALIRWRHPQRGLVPPGDFIPIAETSDLIHRIGGWVIEEAATRLGAWQGTPLGGRRLSINIAATQFQQAGFVGTVLNALERHGAPPGLLELEVTETVIMQDIDRVADRLRRLREAGLRIAIDDFGTGYSSLGYLQDLPLDVLKIDRSFVQRLQEHGDNDQTLVNTILLLGAGLGLHCVVEGVETRAQAEAVGRLGCELIQGYYHSRPVFESELIETVRRIEGGGGLQPSDASSS